MVFIRIAGICVSTWVESGKLHVYVDIDDADELMRHRDELVPVKIVLGGTLLDTDDEGNIITPEVRRSA